MSSHSLMINIDHISKMELFELEAFKIMESNLVPSVDSFVFGRTFSYSCNILECYFNDKSRLNYQENQCVPKTIKLFEKVGFNLDLFKMNKIEICDLNNINYYTVTKED